MNDDILVVLDRLTPRDREYAASALRGEAQVILHWVQVGRFPPAERDTAKGLVELAQAIEGYTKL
jgi:hypothetical protein